MEQMQRKIVSKLIICRRLMEYQNFGMPKLFKISYQSVVPLEKGFRTLWWELTLVPKKTQPRTYPAIILKLADDPGQICG
jgi:hypothetical protein